MKKTFLALLLVMFAPFARAEIEIQSVISPGGVSAWLVEEHSIPFVSIELIFDGGAVLDAPEKAGATNLMMALIEEGAGDFDARAFQEAREGLAANFGFSAYDDSVVVSASFLSENAEDAVSLLRMSLTDPRFDEDAIERVRAQVISNLRGDAVNPNRIAGATMDSIAFGDHPYGRSVDGTLETVAALTRDDLLAAHQAAMTRSRVHVGAAGDITPEALGELIDQLLEGLAEDGPDLPSHVDADLKGGMTVVPFETPQSVAQFAQPGMTRDDPDFFAAYILNEILGGRGVQSRLMEEVREKRGLTYGVYTYLVPKEHAELYLGSVASANDRIADAVEVIQAEWEKMAADGVTQEELDAAKTYLTGAYPLRFDGNGEIAGILAGMQATGLPIEYVTNRNDYINAVSLEEINRVARELLQPENLTFVVVGQPVGLETDVAE